MYLLHIDVSLLLFLPPAPSLRVNKQNLKKKLGDTEMKSMETSCQKMKEPRKGGRERGRKINRPLAFRIDLEFSFAVK